MSGETRVVAFKAIPKREEILLRSFLNLAGSDFDCSLGAGGPDVNANVVVLDEAALKDGMPQTDTEVRYIVLGTNGPYPGMAYVPRPLHWSSFRKVFEETITRVQTVEPVGEAASDHGADRPESEFSLNVSASIQEDLDEDGEEAEIRSPGVSEPELIPVNVSTTEVIGGEPEESALPLETSPGAVPVKSGDKTTIDADPEAGGAAIVEYDDEPSSMALQFPQEDEEKTGPDSHPDAGSADDTVLMETDSIEVWTMSIEAELETVSQSLHDMTRGHLAREPVARKYLVSHKGMGIHLPAGIRFWEGDTEILLGGTPLFLIDETGQRLYSDSPIREWITILRERNLTRRDLSDGWYVDPSVKSSPLPWFVWCTAQARSKGRLLPGIDPGQEYLLEKWPHFELIRNDNQSLKLCALLFSRPESVKSLVAKSDIKGRKVVAFMNACFLLGLIKRTGIDEEVVWNKTEETRSPTLMQRLRRSWGA